MLPVALPIGLLTLCIAWSGSLSALSPGPFTAHMSMHMAVVGVAAPLIALGLAGGRWDPVRKLPRLFAPVPASMVELVAVWVWHAPALHHAARHAAAPLLLEQATFLLSGLLVWLAAFGGDASARANRAGSGVLALLLTSMHMTLLGALLALAPRPLYEHAVAALAHASLTPLQDQHLGGAIMLLVGGASYLSGGLWLARILLRDARTQPSHGTLRC